MLVLAAIPAAGASTLTVTINPASKAAELKSVSTTTITLTYPADSTLSQELSSYSSSASYSGSFAVSSSAVSQLQSGFAIRDALAHIQNVSYSYSSVAKGNATALVITKSTNITAWVTDVFTVANGSVHVDLRWRAFAVPGNMTVNLQGHNIDLNLVGSAIGLPLRGHPLISAFLVARFSRDRAWNAATLNFSALDTPLTTWTRNYDASTNTTTFSKVVSGTATLTATEMFDGQKYTLTVESDPSATITTRGDATASADALAITGGVSTVVSSPSFEMLAVGAAVALVAGLGAFYLVRRSRQMPRSNQAIAATRSTP